MNAVLVAYGDSIIAGWATDFNEADIPANAPFGSPSTRVMVYGRWTDPDPWVRLGFLDYTGPDWVAYSPETGNWNQTGTSPVYSFAEGIARFYNLSTIYLIMLGVSGSDATPLHPNPLGSWHPSISSGIMKRFKDCYLTPALATAELGEGTIVLGMLVSLGQNCCHETFVEKAVHALMVDIHSITGDVARSMKLSAHPSVVLLQNPMLPRAAPAGFDPARVWHSRSLQKTWRDAYTSYGRSLVDIDDVPLQADNIHPTHLGAIEVGNRAYYGLLGAVPSFSSIHHE